MAFLAVWTVAAAVLGAAGVPEAALRPATRLVVQPLWFLGLYLLVVALAPAMLRLHRRFGPAVAVWLAVAAATADVAVRVADLPGLDRLGDLNFLLVWLFAHQLGFLYADGTLPGWPRRAHLAMAAGGLAALTVLTASGAWPRSMVGLPGEPVSNMNPPSLCIVALTIWLVGLAMLVPAAILAPLVALFARFEHPRPPLWTAAGTPSRRALRLATAAGIVAVILGLLGVAVSGIWPLPGPTGELAGLPVNPGGSLLGLGVGVFLLLGGRVGSAGE